MKKLLIILLLLCSTAHATDYAKRYPTGTALPVLTVADVVDGYVPYTGANANLDMGTYSGSFGTVYATDTGPSEFEDIEVSGTADVAGILTVGTAPLFGTATYSIYLGAGSSATGGGATALGIYCSASGNNSWAGGNGAVASGLYAGNFGNYYDLLDNATDYSTILGGNNGSNVDEVWLRLSHSGANFQGLNISTTGEINTGNFKTNDTYTGGANNVFLGTSIGASNSGMANVFIGNEAGKSNTTASNNFLLGYQAGTLITTGGYNTAIGTYAGSKLISAVNNTFIGYGAGNKTTSSSNILIGAYSGNANTTGTENICIGALSGYTNTTGVYNTFIGTNAGRLNLSGGRNTAIGRNAGYSNSTGSYNLFLGFEAGYNETGSNKLYLDISNTATPLIYGEFDNRLLRFGEDNTKLYLGTEKDVFQTYTGTYWDFDIAEATSAIRFNQSQYDTDFIVYGDNAAVLTLGAGSGDITLGGGVAGYDQTLTFNGETYDGILTWKEDEDYFEFQDNVTFTSTSGIILPHLMQSDTTDQAIADVTEEQIITFNTDVHHAGWTRTSSSRFTCTKKGSYHIDFSACTVGASGKIIVIWPKINGTNVSNSSTYYTFKSTGNNAIMTVAYLEHFDVGDYFELWMWGDSTTNKLYAISAVADNPGVTPAIPACPSIILTINYSGVD